jgi:hypothetical protein
MGEKEFDIYEKLIEEFIQQRNSIKEMIVDLEKFKSRIDSILPDSLDKRYIKFFEEKIKAVTELFKVILDMRKEIIKNTKDEFELRRRLSTNDDDDSDLDGIFNIKKLAERVDRLRKEKDKLEQNDILQIPDKTIVAPEFDKLSEIEKTKE